MRLHYSQWILIPNLGDFCIACFTPGICCLYTVYVFSAMIHRLKGEEGDTCTMNTVFNCVWLQTYFNEDHRRARMINIADFHTCFMAVHRETIVN